MANKYLNILVGGANTPINIDDVVTVAATGNAGDVATTAVLTYKNGGTLTLTTPADDNGFAVATGALVVRSLWQAIIAAAAQPWNMVMYPGSSAVYDWTIQPDASVAPAAGSRSYIGQNDTPSGSSTFASKQSTQLLGTGSTAGAAGISAVSSFLSIA